MRGERSKARDRLNWPAGRYGAALVVLFLQCGVASAESAALAGKWWLITDIAGTLKERSCALIQTGSAVGGECVDADGTVLVTGTITAGDASLKYDFNGYGRSIPVVCKGELKGSSLEGVLTLGPLTGVCRLIRADSVSVSASADRKCRRYLGRTIEGAIVTSANVRPATDSASEICVIRGEMPQDLDFEVRMPTRWNGRTVFIGGGGFDGSINVRFISAAAIDSGQMDYATITTNHGHNAVETPDASFALNVQMLSEYAYLAVPRVMGPAKAILRSHYGRSFEGSKTVYEGCSGGGRQGLIQAQRYPDLFDGVIARAPATAIVPQFLWYGKVLKLQAAPGGALAPETIASIGAAVKARCDGLDGLTDGIIGRPDACRFDPAELACHSGETSGCLTPPQVATARGFYEPTSIASGRYTWPGFMPGGESPESWLGWQGQGYTGFMRYMVARDAGIDPLTVDPSRYLARLDYLSSILNATEPDLTRFKSHGGKLLLWTGLADWLITANSTTRYYEQVVEAMGGAAVADEFVEYYTSPDVQHCGGGAGADRFDLVTPMFDWLEKGIKPSSRTIIASKYASMSTPLNRPLCRFPRFPKYLGNDPGSASSFACALPDAVSN